MTAATAIGEAVSAILGEADVLNQRAFLLNEKAKTLRAAARKLLAPSRSKTLTSGVHPSPRHSTTTK